MEQSLKEYRTPAWVNVIALVVWLFAGAVAFLPFAFHTSPLDALRLNVPENQGNWWHALIATPFFLAFPMIWLRLRALFSNQLSTSIGRRFIWTVVGLSMCGTISIEVPFLLHRAGTSELQRLSILGAGFGILIASAVLLFRRRRYIDPTRACLVGINTAYLANASLCLIVYSFATGPLYSRSGWLVTMIIVWPMALELVWLFIQTFEIQPTENNSRFA